jgi:hypothetical protein
MTVGPRGGAEERSGLCGRGPQGRGGRFGGAGGLHDHDTAAAARSVLQKADHGSLRRAGIFR